MSDPLSIAASVAGLLGTSATVLTILRDLYNHAKDAPRSISRIIKEVEEMETIVSQVEAFMSGAPAEHGRLTMLALHDLMATLSGCVLVCNELHRYIGEVADLADDTVNMNNAKRTWERVKWACWKEPEIADFVEQLQRHKHSLNLMLNVVQCHSVSEAKANIAELRDLVEQILDDNRTMKVQLRELITRRSGSDPDDAPDTDLDIAGPFPLEPSSASTTTASTTSASNWSSPKGTDAASVVTTSSSFSRRSIRSVRSIMPSLEESLKGSRAYKRLYRRGGLDGDDSQSQAGFSVASSDKGCDWSMLSDMSLGDLSISDLAVIELPIYATDLYDPEPYRTASRRGTSSKRRYKWSSKSRIHNAISGGNDFVVRTLLGMGFDIEERDGKGQTPLLRAIRRENEVIVSLLLEKGANLEAQDAEGRTPLVVAVRRELETIVRLLLDKGVNLETPDAKGVTALWHALQGNNAATVALLLEKGADRETKNAEGLTPHLRSTTNSTLLIHDAIEHGHEEVIRLLLTLDADVEQRDTQGHTPLAHAAIRNHEAIATLLLQQGANRDAVIGILAGSTTTPENPIHAAITAGNKTVVRLLLAMGADAEKRDPEGLTPLALAVLRNDELSVKLLLEKGASSNNLREIGSTRDLKGKIHSAIEAGNSNVVRLLLVMGVDIEERKKGGLRKTPLLWACNHGKVAMILVAQGADVKACDEQGWTVLHLAVWRDNASLLTFFLDNGALDVIDVPRKDGDTPLHEAALWDKLPPAQILVERGARLNIRNQAGQTPYEYALSERSRNVAKYLWSQLEPNERAQLQPPPSD